MLPINNVQNKDPREKKPDEITTNTPDSINEGVDTETEEIQEEDPSPEDELYDED